jgi:hypothetical protein
MLVAFTSYSSIGCTFLNWSFHRLCGDTKVWIHTKQQWIDVVEDPLRNRTAHNFDKNHPADLPAWQQMIYALRNIDQNKWSSFYGYCRNSESSDLDSCIEHTLSSGVPVIFLECDFVRYQLLHRHLDSSFHADRGLRDTAIANKIKQRFHTVPNIYEKTANNTELRNFLSLSMKYCVTKNDKHRIDKFRNHPKFMAIKVKDFFQDGLKTVKEMSKFLQRDIITARVDAWVQIYNNWKPKVVPWVEFFIELNDIVDSVIAGDDRDLESYKLDVFGEAVIQYELMRRYNTRFVGTVPDQLPTNTKQIKYYLKRT